MLAWLNMGIIPPHLKVVAYWLQPEGEGKSCELLYGSKTGMPFALQRKCRLKSGVLFKLLLQRGLSRKCGTFLADCFDTILQVRSLKR
jgi:hypothetical protein